MILEVDEDAHRFYNRDCECVRILELSEQAGGLPIIVIRFNPQKKLMNTLKQTLEKIFENRTEGMIEVIFIGYKNEYDVNEEIERIRHERKLLI